MAAAAAPSQQKHDRLQTGLTGEVELARAHSVRWRWLPGCEAGPEASLVEAASLQDQM